LFEVLEYKRAKKWNGDKPGKLTGKIVIGEFPTLDAARKFSEGRNQTMIQYPKKLIKEMNA